MSNNVKENKKENKLEVNFKNAPNQIINLFFFLLEKNIFFKREGQRN